MRRVKSIPLPRHQQGATLIIALLVLVLIMMIGITAVSTSDTQYKLAGNLQFEDSALNNAEAAVNAGENWLSTSPNSSNAAFTAVDPTTSPDPGSDAATPGLLPRTSVDAIRAARVTRPYAMTWLDVPEGAAPANSVSADGTKAQLYYIELMSVDSKLMGASMVVGGRASSGCNQVNTYLITGRGASARGATKFVQSYYSVPSC